MEHFLDITAGNVVTWLVMLCGWVAFWVKLKDQVNVLADRQKEVERLLSDMAAQGSPAGRTTSTILSSRVDGHALRLVAIEAAVLRFSGIEADVNWIRRWVQGRMDSGHEDSKK